MTTGGVGERARQGADSDSGGVRVKNRDRLSDRRHTLCPVITVYNDINFDGGVVARGKGSRHYFSIVNPCVCRGVGVGVYIIDKL